MTKAVSGDALTALVARWREQQKGYTYPADYGKCADELEAVLRAAPASANCPHCHLPAVLPEPCTPEVNAVIEAGIAHTASIFEAGRQHEATHRLIAAPASAPPGLSTGQMNNIAMRLIGIRDTLTAIPVPIIRRNIDAAIEEVRATCAPASAPPEPMRKGCINCGDSSGGGYETEEVGPFCAECWACLNAALSAPAPLPASTVVEEG